MTGRYTALDAAVHSCLVGVDISNNARIISDHQTCCADITFNSPVNLNVSLGDQGAAHDQLAIDDRRRPLWGGGAVLSRRFGRKSTVRFFSFCEHEGGDNSL